MAQEQKIIRVTIGEQLGDWMPPAKAGDQKTGLPATANSRKIAADNPSRADIA